MNLACVPSVWPPLHTLSHLKYSTAVVMRQQPCFLGPKYHHGEPQATSCPQHKHVPPNPSELTQICMWAGFWPHGDYSQTAPPLGFLTGPPVSSQWPSRWEEDSHSLSPQYMGGCPICVGHRDMWTQHLFRQPRCTLHPRIQTSLLPLCLESVCVCVCVWGGGGGGGVSIWAV